jgi:DNA polymerase-3 subunit epsilon
MNLNRAVVIDVETSGTNPFRHSVLAVALVPLENDRAPLVVYVRPGSIQWNEFAKDNFKKYANDWEASALAPSVACRAIEQYLAQGFGAEKVAPVGHNIGFDVAFLRQLAFLGGRDEIAGLSSRAVDTHTLLYVLALKGKLPVSALSSDGAFKFFGIEVPERMRHTAIGDALATRELILRLLQLF